MPLRGALHVRILGPCGVAAAASGRLGKRDFGRKARLVLRRAPVWAVLRRRRRRGRAMSGPPTTPLISIYDGRECVGFVISRGKLGFEAFTADQHSLGIFPNQKGAADAITEARTCTQSS